VSKKLPLALLAFALLGGCAQMPSNPKVDPQVMLHFQQTFSAAIYRSISARVQEQTSGAVSLRIIADRQGRALSCEARPAKPELLERLPAEVPRSDPATFARQMEQYCLQGIYPTAPEALYDDKGHVELVAPVQVVFPDRGFAGWRLVNAQRRYFGEHLLKDEQAGSIGTLIVRYQRDASGCLVDLRPHPLRPAEFKLDGALLGRLNTACMGLDLHQVPGIDQLDEKKPVGVVSMEYAPWTVGR